MVRETELAEIPSDGESDDGLCPSDLENEENNESNSNNANIPSAFVEHASEIVDDTDTDEDESEEGQVWKEVSIPRRDVPFTKDFGPNIPDDAKTPLDIYLCLFPHDLLDTIVEQTNLNMQQKKCTQSPITKDELLIFLGINILMGVNKLPSYRDYWSTNPQLHNAYISSLMSVNRFGCILNYLHVNDSSKEPKKGKPGYDKLYKIRPIIDTLNKTFMKCWNPGNYQTIDESMVKFKGRSSLKQYMPAKPIKRGFKIWTRADESGYICQFQVYTGKSESAEKQLGNRVVKDLTRVLVGNNHHIVQDNYFTSPDLLLSLKDEKIFSVGTIRKNRRGLPVSEVPDKTMKVGDYEYRTSNDGLCWVKWFDKKPVYFLSNYHDPTEVSVTQRRQKDGSLLEVNCPSLCNDYNSHMGHVDEGDRKIATYKIDRKCKRWWMRFFWYFQDEVVCNGHVLYLKKNLEPSFTLKKFRLRLVEQMVGKQFPTPRGRKRKEPSVNKHKPQIPLEKRRCQAAHMPKFITSKRRCAHCSTVKNQKRTTIICETCDVPLCLTDQRNCFRDYHK